MLTQRIMHGCIKKLIASKDEESLESLSKLLTTIGKDLEQETAEKLKVLTIDDAKSQVSFYLFVDKLRQLGLAN